MLFLTKAEARRHIRQELEKISEVDKLNRSAKICDQVIYFIERSKNVKSILLYKALRTEVNVDKLIEYCLEKGMEVFLPRIYGEIIEVVPYNELQIGLFNILEPIGESANTAPDMVIVPLMGIDQCNYKRLGKGKGFYDKFFVNNNNCIKVGVAFCEQVMEKLPYEEHDIAMDMLFHG